MSDPDGVQPAAAAVRARRDAERQRRLVEVFGETMPDTTADERDPDATEAAERGDAWLRDQVPPHHGSA